MKKIVQVPFDVHGNQLLNDDPVLLGLMVRSTGRRLMIGVDYDLQVNGRYQEFKDDETRECFHKSRAASDLEPIWLQTVWKDNCEFTDTLTLQDVSAGGRNSGNNLFWLKDSQGRAFFMRTQDFVKAALTRTVDQGKIYGKWTFIKGGKNYTIKLVE